MKYEISIDSSVNFAPETIEEEIVQNVRTILKTRIGTVPFARNFGITWEHLDKPIPVARAVMQAAIVDAVAEFEPRAKVEKVIYVSDGMDGVLSPRVIISIGGNDNE